MTGQDRRRQQRLKNVAMALLLVAFVALFYFITVVKLTGNVSGAA